MLEELRPMGLSKAARALGVDPFEVVRLLVATEANLEHLTLGLDDLAALRESAGIEAWWAEGSLPDDDDPRRAAVRGAFAELLRRGFVGERTTRLDNLWRGLGVAQQMAVEQAVYVLVEEGSLATRASPKGVQVSVTPGQESAIADVAGHPGLSAIWEG